MPLEAKPLFRPDVLRDLLEGFTPTPRIAQALPRLAQWAELIRTGRIDALNERELLPDFLTDLFVTLLGYEGPPGHNGQYTLSREKHVQVDGEFADAVLGRFTAGSPGQFVIAVEGKGPRDPLDRPHAGRRMSAVEQGYKYATNLPCDWIILTSIRQTRLYYKGANQQTFERFDTERLASDPAQLHKLAYLLGAERIVPPTGQCHLYDLMAASERAGRELTKEFYRSYAQLREKVFDRLCTDNPAVDRHAVLTATQKILDRLLFCAFCEDRALLPPLTIQKAYEHADPYNPRPIWGNFKGLFSAVNAGSPRLNIPRYNGGLFADDPLLDQLVVSDDVCRMLSALGEYDYRPAAEASVDAGDPLVDVDILGHIFEQSISDLERLRESLDGGQAAIEEKNDRRSRRKREGAFYTPAFITRYIVEQALGGVVRERFEALRLQHEADAAKAVKPLLADPAAYDLASLKPAGREALVKFWEDWQHALGKVRLLDPACGSGAFLVEAFDQLYAEYETVNDRLADLRGSRTLFDLDRQILQNNLYGVDLNEEAVEICKLSLWIKTAQRGKELTALDRTIRVGNSIVDDPAVHPRAFDWPAAFPEVFADGGFDVVVGNPPYVRQELLSPIKPHLEQRFASYHGMADLYVYFYELGLRVLRPGGRLSLVVTNKWLKANYAEPLRKHLAEKSWVESLVDFGHAKQIFEDADVFPCILVTKKPAEGETPPTPRGAVIPRELLRIDDLSQQIAETAFEVDRGAINACEWRLGSASETQLMAKITQRSTPLGEFLAVRPAAGFATGLNAAFVVDTPTHDRLVGSDPKCAELLRPYLRGQDLERWHSAWTGDWIIFARRGVEIDRYPSIKDHLSKFRPQLEPKPASHEGHWAGRKPGAYKWYEIQDSADCWHQLENPKIIFPDITWRPCASFDTACMFFSKTVYFLPANDLWVLAVLNSPIAWWYSWRTAQHGKDEALRFFKPFVEQFPVPEPTQEHRDAAEAAVGQLIAINKEQQAAGRMIRDWLKVEFDVAKPTLKLQSPLDLDADAFAAEVKKSRGKGRSMTAAALAALRDEHTRTLAPAQALAADALTLERRLSDLVNAAYGLTEAEINLMWQTAPPRMPLASAADSAASVLGRPASAPPRLPATAGGGR